MKKNFKLAIISLLALTAGSSLVARSYTAYLVEGSVDAYNNAGINWLYK